MRRLFKRFREGGRAPPGLHHYRGKGRFRGMALQLRVEPGGRGLLVINANTVLYLNETAALHAYNFMQGLTTDEAVEKMRKTYRVDEVKAGRDYEKLIYTVSTLAQTEEVCPISYLDVERVEPFSQGLSAPLRMDLALTFRCQNDCAHCYIGGPHETQEQPTEYWMRVLDEMGRLGIFIATFTGGEPTLREDLPTLLRHAQEAGLVTNGRRLGDPAYVKTLEDAGLDFAQVTLESHKPGVHDSITGVKGSWKETVHGIKNLLTTTIYTTVNATLNTHNKDGFLETIQYLHRLGVKAFSCNSLIYSGKAPGIAGKFGVETRELKELLPKILEKANDLDMKFTWYTPTRYCDLNPINLGLGVKSCTAAQINLCIGPTGDVYPCQSYFKSLGRFLEDDWETIWNNPLAISLRENEDAPPECEDCPDLDSCGGGCPLEPHARKYICPPLPEDLL